MGSLRTWLWLIGGLYVTAYTIRSATVHLEHFAPWEFGAWWPRMDTELLEHLDATREALGRPLEISPATGSLGRVLEPGDESQHNVARWGQVRAVDVLVPEDMTLFQAYKIARELELWTGIGAYPDWQPRAGLHLDVRPDRTPEDPALWSGRDDGQGGQVYAGLNWAFRDQLPPSARA